MCMRGYIHTAWGCQHSVPCSTAANGICPSSFIRQLPLPIGETSFLLPASSFLDVTWRVCSLGFDPLSSTLISEYRVWPAYLYLRWLSRLLHCGCTRLKCPYSCCRMLALSRFLIFERDCREQYCQGFLWAEAPASVGAGVPRSRIAERGG